MTGDLDLIHAERRNDYGIGSAVRVYINRKTGELVIHERFDRASAEFCSTSNTTISAAGAAKIGDALRVKAGG